MRSNYMGDAADPKVDNLVANTDGLHGGFDNNTPAMGNLSAFTIHTPRGDGTDSHPEIVGEGSNAWLYFSSNRDGTGYNIYRMRTEGRALQLITSQTHDELWPRISPDGRYLAYGSNRLGNWDIFLLDLQDLSRPAMVVTAGSKSDDIHPTWSPDGRHLVYASWMNRIDNFALQRVSFDAMEYMGEEDNGAEEAEAEDNEPASYSPDDNFLIFAELPGGNTKEKKKEMPESMEGYPTISHRGPLMTNSAEFVTGIHPSYRPVEGKDQIAYQDYRKAGKAWHGLRLYSATNGMVTLIRTSETHGAIQPRWSPDGEHIIYTTVAKNAESKGLMSASGGDGFGIATADGKATSDIRNPTFMSRVSDPTWVNFKGEQHIFFSAAREGKEFIASFKIKQ